MRTAPPRWPRKVCARLAALQYFSPNTAVKRTAALLPDVLKDAAKSVIIFAIIIFPLRSSIADWNDVPSGSMRPTILEGDRIFVNKLAYDLKIPFTTLRITTWDHPKRGDVVVFYSPEDGTRMVKRVIGVPGDVLELSNNRLVVNGVPASYDPPDDTISAQLAAIGDEQAVLATEVIQGHGHPVMATPSKVTVRSFPPLRVPEGRYLMLGDNRDNSHDSRYYGFVSRDLILGRAERVVLSLDPQRYLSVRQNRFLLPLS